MRTRRRELESSVKSAEAFAAALDRGLAERDFTAEDAEYRLLSAEVRISCTYGMLLSVGARVQWPNVGKIAGNHYFPPESLNQQYFEATSQKSICPWKCLASYYTIEVACKRNDAAAWYYPHPSPLARRIKDHVAFWNGVQVVPAEHESRPIAPSTAKR